MYTRDTLTLSSNWDTRYLALAWHFGTWSKDPSRQIGAVAIGENGEIIAQGYNGFPRGIEDTEERYNDRRKVQVRCTCRNELHLQCSIKWSIVKRLDSLSAWITNL